LTLIEPQWYDLPPKVREYREEEHRISTTSIFISKVPPPPKAAEIEPSLAP
jgi:hypothetical protein